ncbi:MAG: sulfotransferase, partial [bacterium]|nr:sulfotransferase [bacterium]
FPNEMRFIIDPDGLLNLITALTINYSPYQAREALHRFEKLMRGHLCRPESKPYPGFNFPDQFGRTFYFDALDDFLGKLTEYEFSGSSFFEVPGKDDEQDEEYESGRRRITGAVYYSHKEQLFRQAGEFIDGLFRHALKQSGKKVWAEKTPFNILHTDFLWGLCPNAAVIHIKRDPRAVVYSLSNSRLAWAPDDIR